MRQTMIPGAAAPPAAERAGGPAEATPIWPPSTSSKAWSSCWPKLFSASATASRTKRVGEVLVTKAGSWAAAPTSSTDVKRRNKDMPPLIWRSGPDAMPMDGRMIQWNSGSGGRGAHLPYSIFEN
eukprot:scaffold3946_cov118-Isochrysis_galbana.AAC.10